MEKLRINPKFNEHIPPLAKEEYDGLEELILSEGIRDAIIVWKGFVIDGHNRLEIAEKNGIVDYKVEDIDFPDENAAMLWIISTQLGRRNLADIDKIALANKRKPLIQSSAKLKQAEYHGNQYDFGLPQKSSEVHSNGKIKQNETREQLAKIAGVSHDTFRKGERILEAASPELIQEVREGKKKINTAYREIQTGTILCKVCGVEKPASECPADSKSLCSVCDNAKKLESRKARKNTAANEGVHLENEAAIKTNDTTCTNDDSNDNEITDLKNISGAEITAMTTDTHEATEPPKPSLETEKNITNEPHNVPQPDTSSDEPESFNDPEHEAESAPIKRPEPPSGLTPIEISLTSAPSEDVADTEDTINTEEPDIPDEELLIYPLYTIDAFELEFRENAKSYIGVATTFITAHYSQLWRKKAYKSIAIAALDEVATAINNLKGLV